MKAESIKLDKHKIELVIGSLFKQSMVYPDRAMEIYKKTVKYSELDSDYIEIVEICISKAKAALRRAEEEKKKNRTLFVRVLNPSAHEEEVRVKREEEKEVDMLYRQRLFSIIDTMNKKLGPDASEEQKLAWIYLYVFNKPFDWSYHRYCVGNTFNPFAARVNSINNHRFYKFGIGDAYNLLLSQQENGVCSAKAELLNDLCDVALFKRFNSVTVSGIHRGEGHSWNAIIEDNGDVYYLDSSAKWYGNDSLEMQFMIPAKTFYEHPRYKSDYRDYPHVVGKRSEDSWDSTEPPTIRIVGHGKK